MAFIRPLFDQGELKRLAADVQEASRDIRFLESLLSRPHQTYVLAVGDGRRALATDLDGCLFLDDLPEAITIFRSLDEAEALARVLNTEADKPGLQVRPMPTQDFFSGVLVRKKEELAQSLDILTQMGGTPWYAPDAEPGSKRAWFNS